MTMTGIKLTPRDMGLLYDLYAHTLLTHDQIRMSHFAGLKRPTIQNRLSKLKKAGLIASRRIGVVIYQKSPRVIGVVYQATRLGIGILKEWRPDSSFRDEPVRINSASLAHDLMLTDAIKALRNRFPTATVSHGRLVAVDGAALGRVPDAVVFGPDGKPRIAIELELTGKSDKRYREIITQYRLSQLYPKVLYIINREEIAAKIKAQIVGHRVTLAGPNPPTGKFYFGKLDALSSSPATARLANGTEELSL